jgi:hypothetical protein
VCSSDLNDEHESVERDFTHRNFRFNQTRGVKEHRNLQTGRREYENAHWRFNERRESIAGFCRRNAVTGAEFSALSKLQLLSILPRMSVVGRWSPFEKYRLIDLLTESSEVTAITSDELHNAIAMEKANCRLTVEEYRTEPSKLASGTVSPDNDLSSNAGGFEMGDALITTVARS